MKKNFKHFDDNDENKLIYTTVHNEYVIAILIEFYTLFNSHSNF
jgi:hypothetical protein